MKRTALIACLALAALFASAPSAQADNYALIISAGEATTDDAATNSCFWYNPLLIYESLLTLDFDHDSIVCCYGTTGANFNSSYSCYQVSYTMADYSTSRANIQAAINDLAAVMTSSDFLYVWWMGHGSPSGSNLELYLETTGEYTYDYEMAGWLSAVPYQTRVVSWMTCYSGGILDDMENGSTVVMSSANFSENTYDEWLCDSYHAEFHYPERCAVAWETPCGICGSVDADTDGSGRVSVAETFVYAEANTVNSHPQFSDLGNLADSTYLGTPLLSLGFPDGLPDLLAPGTPHDITVRITEGEESLVPGSATWSYRDDGGAYQTTALTSLGGDLYQVTIPALTCTETPEYYFTAEGTVSGVIHQPATAPATVNTPGVGVFEVFFEETMDSDPGWTTQGQWAWGTPTGGGGAYGNPDPTSGYSGSNVYGYNLAGDYANSLAETHLTSGPIDCSGRQQVALSFWRWLGVETPSYDHAYLRVSNDGSTWTTVWENTSETTDAEWTEVVYDISAVADGQATVYLRWTQGTTDSSWQYCGWNIDDLRLSSFECDVVPPTDTVAADITCLPSSGVLPLVSAITVQLENLTTENRRAAGSLQLTIASGATYSNWRAGSTNLSPSEVFSSTWNQTFPALAALVGVNELTLFAGDVTPPPYNQPPYAAAGDTDSAVCSVTGVAP